MIPKREYTVGLRVKHRLDHGTGTIVEIEVLKNGHKLYWVHWDGHAKGHNVPYAINEIIQA